MATGEDGCCIRDDGFAERVADAAPEAVLIFRAGRRVVGLGARNSLLGTAECAGVPASFMYGAAKLDDVLECGKEDDASSDC